MKDPEKHLKKIFVHPDNFGELLGYKVKYMREGKARTYIKIIPHHLSPAGVVHGGLLSAFVDFSMGAALFLALHDGQRCSTIEFKINYISPVKLGETIYCDSKIKYLGKSHAVIEAHVHRLHGKKDIAVALGTYNIYEVVKRNLPAGVS